MIFFTNFCMWSTIIPNNKLSMAISGQIGLLYVYLEGGDSQAPMGAKESDMKWEVGIKKHISFFSEI